MTFNFISPTGWFWNWMFKRANGIAVEVNVDGKMGVAYRIAAGAREMGGNGGGRDEATQGLSTFRHDNSMAGMRLHALMMNMKCINMTRDLTRAHTKHKRWFNGTPRAKDKCDIVQSVISTMSKYSLLFQFG